VIPKTRLVSPTLTLLYTIPAMANIFIRATLSPKAIGALAGGAALSAQLMKPLPDDDDNWALWLLSLPAAEFTGGLAYFREVGGNLAGWGAGGVRGGGRGRGDRRARVASIASENHHSQ
jgi:hypothetical protein